MTRAVTWSYGGGTQSVAIAVLIAQGKLPKPERTVIADTGMESSETWWYLDNYVRPLLAPCGIEVEIAPHSLATVGLYDHNGDALMPVFTENGKMQTFCSIEWKARVIQRYLRSLGYGPDKPVTTWIGISRDEMDRIRVSTLQWQELYYPLLFSVPLRREECVYTVMQHGLPRPPKSSCWSCPHRRNSQWRHQRDNFPEDHAKAIALDERLRAQDIANGNSGVYLHSSRVALKDANLEDEEDANLTLPGCTSGYCWT